MIAKSAREVSIGSDFHVKPIDGTCTVAAIWHFALHPLKRNCFAGSTNSTGASVAVQRTVMSMNAGRASASGAGQRG
jgi:hypothetical protein